MKSGHVVFIIMVLIFLFFELAYAFLVFEIGDGHVMTALAKSAVLFLSIFLYSKKIKWAKWVLTVLVSINGLVCLYNGMEKGNILFYSIGVYSLFFVFCIYRLRLLKFRYDLEVKSIQR